MTFSQQDTFYDADTLRDECYTITRYLVGQAPPSPLVGRYIEAHAVLLTGEHLPEDVATEIFTRRHPWSLPYLDAALAILRPRSLLRHKILVMIAILEATPHFTEFFFPESLSVLQILWRMVGYGLSIGAKFLIGSVIYLALRGSVWATSYEGG